MRKQNSERGNKFCVCREKIVGCVTLLFFVLFIVLSLLFPSVRYLLIYTAEYYYNFVESKDVGSFLDFVFTDGSNIQVIKKNLLTQDMIFVKQGNEKLYESGFALNYVRDEIPVKMDISDEDGNGKVISTKQFSDFLTTYSKMSFNEFVGNYYIVDSSTSVTENILNVNEFLMKDCTLKEGKKILIYHTHASEGFVNSDGTSHDSVIGVGTYLAELLTEKGYEVIHDTTYYDRENGEINRSVAYSQALNGITKVLEENPDIDVIIDLHRDSGPARTVNINGKDMCKVMLFNGLSYDSNGDIEYLYNPNREYNLAFSFQLKLMSDYLYEDYMKNIYLKNYRFNMHLCEKYLLVEVGTEENTVQEAYNSMEIFAEVLDSVLTKPE
ncbi:MAG: stage II sporulation protein P [Lachnospiraceae bacterium]